MSTPPSLHLPIHLSTSLRMGPYILSISETSSKGCVRVSVLKELGSSPLVSMEIFQRGPTTILRYSGSKVALEEQLEMEIAHVPRVRL